MSSLDGPGALPFTRPESVELVILATDFYYLVTFIFSLLVHSEKHLVWNVSSLAVVLSFLDQAFTEGATWNSERLVTDDPAKIRVEGIESKCDLENGIIVSKLTLVCCISTAMACSCHQGNSSVWKGDMVPVQFVPLSESSKNLSILINFIFTSCHSAQMEKNILDFTSWRNFDQIFECFDLVRIHIYLYAK